MYETYRSIKDKEEKSDDEFQDIINKETKVKEAIKQENTAATSFMVSARSIPADQASEVVSKHIQTFYIQGISAVNTDPEDTLITGRMLDVEIHKTQEVFETHFDGKVPRVSNDPLAKVEVRQSSGTSTTRLFQDLKVDTTAPRPQVEAEATLEQTAENSPGNQATIPTAPQAEESTQEVEEGLESTSTKFGMG